MYDWRDGAAHNGHPWAIVAIVGVLILVGIIIFLLYRLNRQQSVASEGAGSTIAPMDAAEEVLRNRFAHGKIDEDEFTTRLTALRASSSSPAT